MLRRALHTSSRLPYPRGAVACILRSRDRYLLIQRGSPPGVGTWSFAGGKLELGERTLAGAAREVFEETGLPAHALRMHPRPVSVSDAIVYGDDGTLDFHYVIAQTFAWISDEWVDCIVPGDDAADARFFTEDEIRAMPVRTID